MDQEIIKKIQERTEKVPISTGRSNKWKKNYLEDLVFVPAQLIKRPIDYFKEKISSKTILGKLSKKPIENETPILIGAMSFGALSKEAKIAIAKASTLAGTVANTGEGGMLLEEREFAQKLVIQYSTARFGISEDVLKKADAIEIKIGQGAKCGQGGLLPKEKITPEIAQIRNISREEDVHSPAYHKDITCIDELKNKIDWLRKITNGVPIVVKLGAGDIENDIDFAIKTNPDIIAIDGLAGGTGAAPEVMLDEVGIPIIAALKRARKVLDKLGAKQELWVGGGLNKGGDFAKALALGADAIFIGFPLLIAMGCIYCRMCYLGKCPVGIATQDPELRKKLDVEVGAQKVANYIKNCNEELKMIAGACGEDNIHKLNGEHLRALNKETAKVAGVKMV
ncbi:FMN-binding glutamate synthase family protein [Dehalococcoidia bacterium]|nr:FMN-binding glutamate synthase family protein [Dehalococcoidia bacterium]